MMFIDIFNTLAQVKAGTVVSAGRFGEYALQGAAGSATATAAKIVPGIRPAFSG
ncbi:MAG: hypothetical protein MO853_00510 [Candidatus Protistobacter heckmanni]|nr:hypothetical protein [Candidatus Protistobacter heckmanni]